MRFRLMVVALFLMFAAAVASAQQSLPPDPAFVQQYQAGRTALEAGKNQDAIDAFKQANKMAHHSCAECFMGMAVAYTRMARLSDATDSCNKAVAAATSDEARASAHILKGKALLSGGAGISRGGGVATERSGGSPRPGDGADPAEERRCGESGAGTVFGAESAGQRR